MTVVGTRPEIIRLSRVVSVLRQDCEHTLIHTGQNYDYELNQILFDDLGLAQPDIQFEVAKSTPMQTISQVLSTIDSALREIKPDAVLVLGDTNSGLSLLAARRLSIPTFHMEAGNRCFDPRVPEEINRRIIDHVADVNLPYSQIARENLLREGIPSDRIVVTGSPLAEVLDYYKDAINQCPIVDRLDVQSRRYFLVSLHREENVDLESRLERFVDLLNLLADREKLPIILSTHPRTRQRLDVLNKPLHAKIQLVKPLAFTEYVSLQLNAKAVLSDSGTISEESSILGFKAVNLRETHERPEAMENASVMMVGSNKDRLFQVLDILNRQGSDLFSQMTTPPDYQHLNVAEKISRIIHSYVDYVRRRNATSDSGTAI